MGFRDLVENMGQVLGLKGMVYNALDGSVRIVTVGDSDEVDELIQRVKENSRNVGAEVSAIEKDEVEDEIEMPGRFFKAPTDELGDLGRKLDKGVNLLGNINEGQEEGFNRLAEGQDSLVEGQDRIVENLERNTEVLERISKQLED